MKAQSLDSAASGCLLDLEGKIEMDSGAGGYP